MKTVLKLILFNLFCFILLRLGFLIYFAEQAQPLSSAEIFSAFFLGTKFDLRFALILALPFLLLFKLPALNVDKNEAALPRWVKFYTLLAALWIASYFLDFGYFEYLDARVNGTALHFFRNPLISAQMVWQTYPLPSIVLGFVALLLAYRWVLKKFIFTLKQDFIHLDLPISSRRRWMARLAFTLFFVAGAYGKFSYYPLRWSEAFSHSNNFAAALGLNPVLYFFETLKFKNNAIDIEKAKKYYPTFAQFLGIESPSDFNFKREVTAQREWATPPNVIIVVMESLASHRTNLMSNPISPTPELARIARDSYLFSEHYVPSEGSARSMFGLVTGVADVSTVKTASRNPFFVDQRVIANQFKDYEKFFMIGGSANWANIRAVFTNNIKGLEVLEEGMYTEPRSDVWGLSDYHLFKEAVKKIKKQDKPFLAFIQAASFHRPYTIPEDRGDFKELQVSKEELSNSGFESLAEYNSMRFSDWALGYFYDEIRNLPNYENTIFVITGDHGLPENQANFFPEKFRHYEKEKFHVPLVIHSKKLFPTGYVDPKPASEVDIVTTIASLAGISHTNYTLGRDLFNPDFDNERYAFTYTYYNPNRKFALIGDRFVLHSDITGRSSLFEKEGPEPTRDVKAMYPLEHGRMLDIARGYLYSAEYLLRNNKKLP